MKAQSKLPFSVFKSIQDFLAKLTEITVCAKGPQLISKSGTFSHDLASLWRGDDLRMGLTADLDCRWVEEVWTALGT